MTDHCHCCGLSEVFRCSAASCGVSYSNLEMIRYPIIDKATTGVPDKTAKAILGAIALCSMSKSVSSGGPSDCESAFFVGKHSPNKN